jgi:hypothetical protein
MWSTVEHNLTALLVKKVFPALLGAHAYDNLLSGGRPDPVKCKSFANHVVANTDLTDGIREKGVTGSPKVDEWVQPLFRAVTIGKNNPNGAWWFEKGLLDRWMRKYPPGTPNRKQLVMESIRPMLAVSFNWNDFQELQVMTPTSPIPVIIGEGRHQPIFSPDPRDQAAQKKYEEHKNVVFIGGHRQVFVPIVNARLTQQHVF